MPENENIDELDQKDSIQEISDEVVKDFIEDIIKLEQDHLYINRANLKEKIVELVKARIK